MSADYKDTVFLPKTDFPMRAGLPKREPELLARWAEIDLWRQLRAQSAGRDPFILHDGPPYANGHLHIGHALNKILKDIINRFEQMRGKNAYFVPGWDCHGLPIEWKIEEKYREEGRDKDEVPIVEFRQECREFADHWIDVQREEFKRMGVVGDWDEPYTTMAYSSEANIAAELLKFADTGQLYRGSKPVMWSVVEKTALADAEVEYKDHTSNTIYVKFKVTKSNIEELIDNDILIWTTTPWTIPGNRALAYSADLEYILIQIIDINDSSIAKIGDKIMIAKDLQDSVIKEIGVIENKVINNNTEDLFEAENFVIATGARAKKISNINYDNNKIITYKEAMIQEKIPKSLIIIGAGAIGVEFAHLYNSHCVRDDSAFLKRSNLAQIFLNIVKLYG